MSRSGVVGVVAAAAVIAALVCPAPDVLAAPEAGACVTSQLRQVPGVQGLTGSVPVVFIHGINSSAGMWDSWSGGSIAGQSALIKGVTAWTFDYAHQSLEWVDKQPIGPSFATAISCLAQASGHKVIIVAHSMGGLAAQYAIGEPRSPAAAHVAELITIGTPYRGSLLLTAMQAVISGSEVTSGNPYEAALAEALLSACAGVATHTDQNPCWLVSVPRSPVGAALEANSPEIQQLPPWPTDLPVLDTAGDIRIQVGIGPLTFSHDFGDVPVSVSSATAHDTAGQPIVQYCGAAQTMWDVVHSSGGCFHTHLPNDPKIITAVLGAIRADANQELVQDLHQVNWKNATIPGKLCQVNGSITLHNWDALVPHSGLGPLEVGISPPVIYGDLGSGQRVAAVQVWCSNQGGTAAGQLSEGVMVFDGAGGQLHLLGILTPQYRGSPDSHIPFLITASISTGRIVTAEHWYTSSDSDCCPSGRATTIWNWNGSHFTPSSTVVSRS
jgi:pimeloyl-ACP methyl ester carboxylesterase